MSPFMPASPSRRGPALLRFGRRPQLRVGLISDVHANLELLERALALLERAGVDKLACLGDIVEKGPEPDAVVERLAALAIPCVRGNHDDNALRHAALDPSGCGMSSDTLAWLDALPHACEYEWAGRRVALAHITPADDGVAPRPGELSKRMRRWLDRSDADFVLLGHTHVPMHLRWRAHRLCNPGSVSHGRCARGPTCAVLSLPDAILEVHALAGGEPELLAPCDALA